MVFSPFLKKGHPFWSKTKTKTVSDDFFVVRTCSYKEETMPALSFGLIVQKKVGCAVVRNLIKRRLRQGLRKLPLFSSSFQFFLIIIKNPQVASTKFKEMILKLTALLEKCTKGWEK